MNTRLLIDAFVLRFPRTGIVNYAYNIIKRLNERSGVEVEILLQDLGFHDPELGAFAQSLPHHLAKPMPGESRVRELMGDLWQNPGLLLPLPGVSTRQAGECDVYHCTDVFYYPSRRARTNVITIHDITTELFPETHDAINIAKETAKLKALDGFDRIVTVSESTRQDLINVCGVDADRIVTNHLGVDAIYDRPHFTERDVMAHSLGIPAGRRYVLGVSTIEPRKNIIGALEAFRLFVERNPQDDDLILVLAGHYGWNNEKLQAYLASYKAIDRVFFTGFAPLELMPALYHHAEAFMYLSLYEGFGLPILEAMKSGAPVICSNISSMPEIIGDCGITVDPRKVGDACDALERLIHSRRDADAFRKAARKRSALFSWDAHVDRLLEIYEGGADVTAARESSKSSADGGGRDRQPLAEVQSQDRYRTAVQAERNGDAEAHRSIHRHIESMLVRPTFVVLIAGPDSPLRKLTSASCDAQSYAQIEIISDPGEASRFAKAPNYLVILQPGDRLHPDALYHCAARINADPLIEMIYFNEDVMDQRGERSRPFLKPAWSPDYLEAVNYIGSAACYAMPKAVDLLEQSRGQYDFTLRFTEQCRSIAFLDRVLLHRRTSLDEPHAKSHIAAEMRALAGRLARTGRKGKVTAAISGKPAYTIAPSIADSPLVSIVIPTAAKVVKIDGRSRDLIGECVKSIVERSTYRNIEFVVVDNGDLDHDRLGDLGGIPLRKVTYSGRQVNISHKMNLGAANAAGEFLILLNDDTEIHTPDWIERQLFHFEKPHVGMVGGKLLYPDETIQHIGVVVIHGHPDHVSRGKARDDEGYFFSGRAVRNYHAATGAMTMIRAKLYREVGGYEELMPLTFNDIDLCMKVGDAGFTVVIDPEVILTHFEGKSATNSYNFVDRDRFMARWGQDYDDPYYNVRYFNLSSPDFTFVDNGKYI